MSLKENELARRADGAVECRRDAMRVEWNFAELPTSDAHALVCRFSCSVRIADSDADRRMCAETFLSKRDVLTFDCIVEHFGRCFRVTMESLASQCKAADAIGGFSQHKWIDALTAAAKPLAFASGLELLAPFSLHVESPTQRRQKQHDVAAARQTQHLQRATGLLKQFQAMRESAPQLSAGKLLERFDPADRGAVLQSLLLASSEEPEPAPIWAVAGQALAKIHPRSVPPKTQLQQLSGDLGALRSVRSGTIAGKRMLFVGAQRGVIVVDPEGTIAPRLYEHPVGSDTQLGFNSIITDGCHLWASHGAVGIMVWQLDDPSIKSRHLEGTGQDPLFNGPRNLHMLNDSRLIYSVGSEIFVSEHEKQSLFLAQSTSHIVTILQMDHLLVVVRRDGILDFLDRSSGEIVETRRRGTRICAASTLRWMNEMRLLLATDEGPIDCIGLDDPIVTEYLSPYRGLKELTASRDLIAAVSPDRQRVVVWQTWDGERPVGEIHLTAQTRHRVADIRFEQA